MFTNNSENKCLVKIKGIYFLFFLFFFFFLVKQSTEQKLSFLHATLLLDLIYVPTKHYKVISNSIGVTACTRFRHRDRTVHNGESASSLARDTPTVLIYAYTKYYHNISNH